MTILKSNFLIGARVAANVVTAGQQSNLSVQATTITSSLSLLGGVHQSSLAFMGARVFSSPVLGATEAEAQGAATATQQAAIARTAANDATTSAKAANDALMAVTPLAAAAAASAESAAASELAAEAAALDASGHVAAIQAHAQAATAAATKAAGSEFSALQAVNLTTAAAAAAAQAAADAAEHKGYALAYRNAASTEADRAAASAVEAAASANGIEAAQIASEAAQAASEAAKAASEAASAASKAAQLASEAARNASQQARDQSAASADAADASEAAALTYRDDAAASAAGANASKIAALAARDAARAAQTAAEAAQAASEAARDAASAKAAAAAASAIAADGTKTAVFAARDEAARQAVIAAAKAAAAAESEAAALAAQAEAARQAAASATSATASAGSAATSTQARNAAQAANLSAESAMTVAQAARDAAQQAGVAAAAHAALAVESAASADASEAAAIAARNAAIVAETASEAAELAAEAARDAATVQAAAAAASALDADASEAAARAYRDQTRLQAESLAGANAIAVAAANAASASEAAALASRNNAQAQAEAAAASAAAVEIAKAAVYAARDVSIAKAAAAAESAAAADVSEAAALASQVASAASEAAADVSEAAALAYRNTSQAQAQASATSAAASALSEAAAAASEVASATSQAAAEASKVAADADRDAAHASADASAASAASAAASEGVAIGRASAADASATASSASATAASASATAADLSKQAAGVSAGNAATSEAAADASKVAAAGSATAANASATAAAGSAVAADLSKQAAAASASAADASKTAAAGSATAADASKTAAAGSATTASNAAATATAAKDTSVTKAGEAAASATTAVNARDVAITHAAAAAVSAQEAAGYSAESQPLAGRDATGGYPGLTGYKLNLKNALGTLISFLTNSNTAARTYTLPDRDMTIAGTDDLAPINAAIGQKIDSSARDAVNGVAGLDTSYRLRLKNAAGTFVSFFTNANTAARTYTLPDKSGTVAMTSDITGTNSGVNTGDQTAASLGLGNVNNTSDAAKPISSATQAALDGKASITYADTKASITYVDGRFTTLLGAAPAVLDTLAEIATAFGNDANFAATMTTSLAGKAPLNGAGAYGNWPINAATAAASPLLSASGNYAYLASALPAAWPLGETNVFVQPTDGWPEYGTVVTTRSYSGGGGSLQMYTPYGPANGGSSLKFRMGDYSVGSGNSWTAWHTIVDSLNIGSYAPSLYGAGASGTWNISILGGAPYATATTRLYSATAGYGFGEANPYYMTMTYNSPANRWRLAVTPGNPANIEVNYADTAGVASKVQFVSGVGGGSTFNWTGQGGQPTWLWGGTDSAQMYVYNPSNFSVDNSAKLGGVGSQRTMQKRNACYNNGGPSLDTITQAEYGFAYPGQGNHSGPFIHFGGLNQDANYGAQISCSYGGAANMRFRTKNDDATVWNPWVDVYHTGNMWPASVAAAGNTMVQRTANGYIEGSYINMTEGGSVNGDAGTVTGIICKRGDHYYRNTTAVSVKTFLGITGADVYSVRTNTDSYVGVCREMAWANYGNGHTIFDASQSLSPAGSAVNNANATSPWVASYPTLMGWNGSQTYGVRVDSCRLADSASTVGGMTPTAGATASTVVTRDGGGYSDFAGGTIGRVISHGIWRGSYGSISIRGVTNTYAGIDFTEANGTFMSNGTTTGWFYNNASWAVNWDNSGNVVASGNVTAYSDERLKTNWRDASEDFVALWAGVKSGTYDRTDIEQTQVGVSAQAVQAILPDAVQVADDELGTLSLNYGGAAMVATVELAKMAIAHEQQISSLAELVKSLVGRIEELEEK